MTAQCDHGQLARSCLLCEMRDENLALRALVAELNEARNYATNLFRLLAPQCEPLATVPGLLTQIDNWCAGAKSDLADCQFRGVGAKVTLVRHRAPSRPRFAVKRVILDDIK